MFVPVFDANGKTPLMPTTPSRARRWMRDRKATGFWQRGIYCVRLNQEPLARETQPICIGVDPGSRREALTVKSEAHTYLNIQATAVDWVKDKVATRRNMRRARRFRKTPCRKNRINRVRDGVPPSTKARWQWKLRLLNRLRRLFPMTDVAVEDVVAVTKAGKRRWNVNFSPIEVGKQWFYAEIKKFAALHLFKGFETAEMRTKAGLKKTKNKLAGVFSAHCVDSWVLANVIVGGHIKPDNERMLIIEPLKLFYRQLHRLQPAKGGVRSPYGGTISEGFKRGSLVIHPKYRLTYVGGTSKSRISLHHVKTGKRLTQNAKPQDLMFLTFNSWRVANAA
jgi:hypothetical protein